jgi:hypothetical protein
VSETREFTTGAVISAATGKMCCDLDELYDILGWLVGESLMTHQLPGAATAVEGDLKRQHPWIAELDTDSVNRENVRAWYDGVVVVHGSRTTVARVEDPEWIRGNALQDLQDIAGGKPVLVVEVPEAQ